MFVVDYLSAFLLAVTFTIAFAGAIRERNYRSWRDMPVGVWLLAAGSWLVGAIVVGLGAAVAHWLTFVLGAVALVIIAVALMRAAFRKNSEIDAPENDSRPAIALYFCMTVLLFFCAISLRFYVVNLS